MILINNNILYVIKNIIFLLKIDYIIVLKKLKTSVQALF